MPGLPAICDSCLTVWDPHAINIANATDVHIEDFTVGPCPKCGGTGHIPDGIYSATTDTINVVATTVKSAQALALLGRLLRHARNEKVDAEQLAQLLEQEKAADFKPVAAVVRRLPRKLDVKYWIGITLAVIAILQAQAADRKLDNIESQVEHIYAEVVAPPATAKPTAIPRVSPAITPSPYPKVGRNQPCPCGSGKKYKRCHGA
jgi:hypothetical protein